MIATVAAGLVLRQVLLLKSFHDYPDDAYIFFRYARSAATGDGLVFNSGAHVMGYSSPLYVLLLATLGAVFGQHLLAGIANILGLLLFVATSVVLIRLVRRGHCEKTVLLVGWIAYLPIAAAAVSGMETMLFLLLFFIALLLLLDGRIDAALPVVALLILTRIEGLLFAFALALGLLFLKRPKVVPIRGLTAFFGILGAWALFAQLYYGDVVPQSVIAKAESVTSSGAPFEKLVMLSVGLSTQQFHGLPATARSLLVILGIVVGLIVVVGLIRDIQFRSLNAVVPAWFLLTWIFYVVGDPFAIASWYSAPTTMAVWWVLARHGRALLARARIPHAHVVAAVTAVAVVTVSLPIGVSRRAGAIGTGTAQVRNLATAVEAVAPSARTVMLNDIGYVGWTLRDVTIVDGYGLVSPEAVPRNGQVESVAALLSKDEIDAACLYVTPDLSATTTDPYFHRPLWSSPAERDQLLRNYIAVPVDAGAYQTILLRRSLATRS